MGAPNGAKKFHESLTDREGQATHPLPELSRIGYPTTTTKCGNCLKDVGNPCPETMSENLYVGHFRHMLIGYSRVSTADQNPDHQVDALRRAGVLPRTSTSTTRAGRKRHVRNSIGCCNDSAPTTFW